MTSAQEPSKRLLPAFVEDLRDAAGRVLRNGDLRRVQVALAATAVTTPAYAIALTVYAYRAGGVSAVGLTGAATLLPAGLLAPALALLSDRGRRDRVLSAALLLRAVALAANVSLIVLGAPFVAVLGLATVSSIAARIARPAQAALVPSLARNGEELAAANALAATVDEVGTVAGPAAAGALLLVAGPEAVIATSALAALGAALAVRDLTSARPNDTDGRAALLAELAAGFVTVWRAPGVLLPVVFLTLQAAAFGALVVLMAPLAIDRLQLGEPGLGLLEVALGAGGVAGGFLALGVAAGGRLGSRLALGTTLWGAAVALVGVWPQVLTVPVLLATVGAMTIFVDVPAYTIVQRETPDAVLGRVFGVIEGLAVAGTAAGAALAPALVVLGGLRASFVTVGLALVVPALLGRRSLLTLDEPSDEARGACVPAPRASSGSLAAVE